MNIIICGDDYRNSDIGLFCKRIETWKFHRAQSGGVYYLNAISGENILPGPRVFSAKIVTNIGNNIYFPLVIYKAIAAQQCILKKDKNVFPLTLDGCIIHDVNLEYSAHLIAESIVQKKLHDDFRIVEDKLSFSIIEMVYDWLIPDDLKNNFINSPYSERGYFLLHMVLKKHTFAVCHSDYAIQTVEKFKREHNLNNIVEKINLAYDIPKINKSFTINYPDDFRIRFLLFGMAFSASKALTLLFETLAKISTHTPVLLQVAGKTNNSLIDDLYKKVASFKNIKILVHGFISTENLIELVSQSHFAWAYRVPTHGESSGTVLRAMSFGCCPIVADHGWYSELPSDLALRVRPEIKSEELAQIIIDYFPCVEIKRKDRVNYIAKNNAPALYSESLLRLASRDSPTYENTNLFLNQKILKYPENTKNLKNKYQLLGPTLFELNEFSLLDYISDTPKNNYYISLLNSYSSFLFFNNSQDILKILSLCLSPFIGISQPSGNIDFYFGHKIELAYDAMKNIVDCDDLNTQFELKIWSLSISHGLCKKSYSQNLDNSRYINIIHKLFLNLSRSYTDSTSKRCILLSFLLSAIALDLVSWCDVALDATSDECNSQNAWSKIGYSIFLEIMQFDRLFLKDNILSSIYPTLVQRAYILGQSLATRQKEKIY